MDWLDLLAVQGTLKSLLQYHSSKASILWSSAFFTVQLSHPYMSTGKTIALTRQTFVGKVMSIPFNMLSRLVITFLPRSKRLLISWLQCLFPNEVICWDLGGQRLNIWEEIQLSLYHCHSPLVADCITHGWSQRCRTAWSPCILVIWSSSVYQLVDQLSVIP